MKFHVHKSTFLSNKMNIQWIINLVGMHLTQQGYQVVHSNDDADLDIVMTCINSAEMETTTLIGEDTDLIILLLYWMPTSTFNIYVRSDINIGKQKAVTNINKNEELKEKALLFCTSGLSQSDVEQIGCSVMVYLFGGSSGDSLNYCSCWLFLEKVMVSKNFVKPERLPPTQSAAKYHCFRVYYQMCVWRKCCFDMDPTERRWYLRNNKCTTGCSTMRCGCRNRGLPCASACGDCQIFNCDNSTSPYEDNSEEDEFE
ncbi:hypothetical protein PR048_001435 [Dryococelus australis]|uniref:Uncharacterized protein n=1 Tax=Dryococelus australis TaxID=614101 RepID=A0ABQ9IJR7_9NEOP|nr:hypothetical protein PR048_001435 [Dryococelus australis]